MLGFLVTNLLIPGDPVKMSITTPSGHWKLEQTPDFARTKAAITGATAQRPQILPVGETYFLENATGMNAGAAAVNQAFAEVTPVLLAATYATGMSVTIQRSTPVSECTIMQPTEHWPRVRAMDRPSYVVSTGAEFQHLVEAFVTAWSAAGQTQKALLLVHHWLDSLSCWSMEDLYLSATTLLQVIVATEATRQGKKELPFYSGLMDAANHMGISSLGPDFKNMRNELVHDGKLIGKRFAGPDKAACAQVVADVLNWFDQYVHVALSLGPVTQTRFQGSDFMALNAYSIY